MNRCWRVVVILVAMLTGLSGTTLAAGQAPDDERLMLSHEARFTAEIPASWEVDQTQLVDYGSFDGGGYIQSTTYSTSFRSLPDICFAAAGQFDGPVDPGQLVTWVTFQGQLACRIEPVADGGADNPVILIFRHPNPLRSGTDGSAYFGYAGVMVDRAHFIEVTASMRFDLDDVSPALYLTAAIDIVEGYAFVRDEIDWETVRRDADDAIQGNDVGPGLDIALNALGQVGDNHSYRWVPAQLDTFTGTSAGDIPEAELPTSLVFSESVSYIDLPPVQGDASVYQLYATAGNQAIAEADSATTCGWIIDLRTNFGGNSEPMIAAVGEILGDGEFGGDAFSNGITVVEAYRDGSVFDASGNPGISLIDGDIYELEQPDAAVALLIGPVTGSAAEYTAIAFLGRDDVRTFGEPSADLTTGISGFVLVDGSALGLATSAMVDRDGNTYPDGIEPDTLVEDDIAQVMDPGDPMAAAAEAWLIDQPACQ